MTRHKTHHSVRRWLMPRHLMFRQIELATKEYAAALKLRNDVLLKPLGLSITPAEMEMEKECFHLAGFDGERLIAIGGQRGTLEWLIFVEKFDAYRQKCGQAL